MSLKQKLASVERKMRERIGRCPKCFGMGLVHISRYPFPQPSPCPVCGREANCIVELHDHVKPGAGAGVGI